jgi:sensor c-di-GMP phosphodiesterase-like protein
MPEGIETYHESHKLQGLGVLVGQGFLYAKPMPKSELLEKISSHTGKRRVAQPRPWWQFGAAPPARSAGRPA